MKKGDKFWKLAGLMVDITERVIINLEESDLESEATSSSSSSVDRLDENDSSMSDISVLNSSVDSILRLWLKNVWCMDCIYRLYLCKCLQCVTAGGSLCAIKLRTCKISLSYICSVN